jgi:hypothetical protein
LSGITRSERGTARRQQDEPGVTRQLGRGRQVDGLLCVQRGHRLGRDVDLGHPGPAGVDGLLGLVLLGVQPERGRLDPHRQVLADHGDGLAVRGQAARDGQDPGVVVERPEAGRQHRRVGVVQLDPQRPTELADR